MIQSGGTPPPLPCRAVLACRETAERTVQRHETDYRCQHRQQDQAGGIRKGWFPVRSVRFDGWIANPSRQTARGRWGRPSHEPDYAVLAVPRSGTRGFLLLVPGYVRPVAAGECFGGKVECPAVADRINGVGMRPVCLRLLRRTGGRVVPVGRVRACPSPFFSLAVAGMDGASRIRSCGAAAPPLRPVWFFWCGGRADAPPSRRAIESPASRPPDGRARLRARLAGDAWLASRAAAPVLNRGEGGGGASSCRWKSLLLFGGAPVSAAPVVAVSRRSWPCPAGRGRRPTAAVASDGRRPRPACPVPARRWGVRGCSARCGGREKTGRIV